MMYAGTAGALQRAFTGVMTKITATDMSELEYEGVVDACKKFA
jgi:hypothetical protein